MNFIGREIPIFYFYCGIGFIEGINGLHYWPGMIFIMIFCCLHQIHPRLVFRSGISGGALPPFCYRAIILPTAYMAHSSIANYAIWHHSFIAIRIYSSYIFLKQTGGELSNVIENAIDYPTRHKARLKKKLLQLGNFLSIFLPKRAPSCTIVIPKRNGRRGKPILVIRGEKLPAIRGNFSCITTS